MQAQDILPVINRLRPADCCKLSGHDNIDSYFIRVASDAITSYLTQLCHLSFEFGIFPDVLKITKIILVFKSGIKTEVNNYRPISLLSNFLKILEKLIYSRLTMFLEKFNILHSYQYGFRKNVSTLHAILDMYNGVSFHINEKNFSGLVFLDLKKPFDTVSHDIFLQKFNHYGIRGKVNDLFRTYLAERKQYVSS